MKRLDAGFWNWLAVFKRKSGMGLVVVTTFITWLLVEIIAFGARPAQIVDNAEKDTKKRSTNNEM